jgi:hypothetical protein
VNSTSITPDDPSHSSTTLLTVTLSPAFKLIFCSVLAITIVCLILGCSLVGLTVRTGRTLTPQEDVLFDLCTSTFKLGFGTIIGLLGGKAL